MVKIFFCICIKHMYLMEFKKHIKKIHSIVMRFKNEIKYFKTAI